MSYDDDAQAMAGEMLALKANGGSGQPITLTHVGEPTYNVATGANVPGSTVMQTGSGVLLEYNTFIRSGIRDDPNSLIQAGDKQLLVSPLNAQGGLLTPPVANDTVLVNGVLYTITSVSTLAPAGLAIMYTCNIRGSS